jgi:hypothetical protein
MSVVTVKSTAITARDATPTTPVLAAVDGASLKEFEGFVTATNGDSATSKYIIGSVPSNCRMSGLILQCAALGAGAAVDVGVYAPTQSIPALVALGYAASAAISSAFFATAVDVSSALGPTEVINESGTNTIAKQEKELWDALGLSKDPGCRLDIAITVSVAIAATGSIGLKGRYAI